MFFFKIVVLVGVLQRNKINRIYIIHKIYILLIIYVILNIYLMDYTHTHTHKGIGVIMKVEKSHNLPSALWSPRKASGIFQRLESWRAYSVDSNLI